MGALQNNKYIPALDHRRLSEKYMYTAGLTKHCGDWVWVGASLLHWSQLPGFPKSARSAWASAGALVLARSQELAGACGTVRFPRAGTAAFYYSGLSELGSFPPDLPKPPANFPSGAGQARHPAIKL